MRRGDRAGLATLRARRAAGVDHHPRRDRSRCCSQLARHTDPYQPAGDGAGLSHLDADLPGAGKKKRVEIGAPDLNPAPRSARVAAEGFEATRTAPLDPNAWMAGADDLSQPIRNSKLPEQRLDARMQRLAGPVAAKPLALAQHNPQAARSARDRGGAARRSAANDDYVGIDWSTRHASP
jgi:hypothetical protein